MATLDRMNTHGDRSYGTSDPRLVRNLMNLPPYKPNTPAQEAAARRYVQAHAPERWQPVLLDMIFGTATATANPAKEAA